jgi:hypothetical protein
MQDGCEQACEFSPRFRNMHPSANAELPMPTTPTPPHQTHTGRQPPTFFNQNFIVLGNGLGDVRKEGVLEPSKSPLGTGRLNPLKVAEFGVHAAADDLWQGWKGGGECACNKDGGVGSEANVESPQPQPL